MAASSFFDTSSLDGGWSGWLLDETRNCKLNFNGVLKFGPTSLLGSGVTRSPGEIFVEYFDILGTVSNGKVKMVKSSRRPNEESWLLGTLGQSADEGFWIKGSDLEIHRRTTFKFDTDELKLNAESSSLANLRNFFKETPEAFSDFQIICSDGSVVKCHKIILASQSRYFEALFRHEPDRNSQELVDISFETVKTVVNFMSTALIEPLDEVDAVDLMTAANYLQIEALMYIAAKLLGQKTDFDNCIDVANLAMNINNHDLLDPCIEFIASKFIQLYEAKRFHPVSKELMIKILADENIILHDHYGRFMPLKPSQVKLSELVVQHLKETGQKTNQLSDYIGKSQSPNRVMEEVETMWTQTSYGSAPDTRHNSGKKWEFDGQQGQVTIRKIDVISRTWDTRHIIGGLKLYLDNNKTLEFGCKKSANLDVTTLTVPDGQHIATVHGQSGWYIDQLEFITNTGLQLGPVGGNGGSVRFIEHDIDPTIGLERVYLDGIRGKTVESQDRPVIASVSFKFVIKAWPLPTINND